VSSAFSGIADLLERSRVNGPMREAPVGFALALTSAIADATIDAMIREPGRAETNGQIAFDAIWRSAVARFPRRARSTPWGM
jgi:hypothetical protein